MKNIQRISKQNSRVVKKDSTLNKFRMVDDIVYPRMLDEMDSMEQNYRRTASLLKPASIQVTISKLGIEKKDDAFSKLCKCLSEIVKNKSRESATDDMDYSKTNYYCRRHRRFVRRRLRSCGLFWQ